MTWADLDADVRRGILTHYLADIEIVVGEGRLSLKDYLRLINGPRALTVIQDIARKVIDIEEDFS